MSLRIKLALLLSTIVGGTLFIAWVITGRTVIQPFAREVLSVYLDEVVYIAEQVEQGADPEKLGRMLNLEVRLHRDEPGFIDRINRKRGGPFCSRELRGKHEIVYCRGARGPAAVETSRGWVVARRDLDVGAPGKRIGELLLFIALAVFIFSGVVAVAITRPLKTTTDAMEKIARGDLSHRLSMGGGKELSELARSFNAMADRVDGLLRTERELMAGISHELRTPLARLRLQTELLRDTPISDQRLGAMDADLQEIDELIGELLECSRLSLGERKLQMERVDLKNVVDEAIERYPLPNHRVIVTNESNEPVLGDHARLVRVVGNLLQNAGKYAPEGTEVTVAIEKKAVEVLDRGPGAPPEEMARLFEPFYRGAHARSHTKHSGLGLGLMIARQVITLHGGEIAAKNRPDGGLAIRFELPANV